MNTIHAFASKLTGARVDFDKRVIHGVVVMTIGKAFGHASVDATTLEQFKSVVNGEKIRGREDHPDENLLGKAPLTKKLEDLRGYFFNLRIEGEKLVADFQALSEEAGGKPATQLLFKAHEAPEVFGVSPVFFGKPENNVARVSKVAAIDFVDIPAGDDANQQLFKGEAPMDPIKVTEREGKFYAKFEADMPAGEYEVAMPETPKKVEDKDKDEMEASTGDDNATKKDVTVAQGAKAYSAADLAAAKSEGVKELLKFSAEFNGVMDSINLAGKERDEFHKKHFDKAHQFGIGYAKEIAQVMLGARAQPVGSGGMGATDGQSNNVDLVQRFSANPSLRAAWGVMTRDDENSPTYKAALAKYLQAHKESKVK